MHRLAILSSSVKSAHISRAIIAACRSGKIPDTTTAIIIGSRPNAAVLTLAKELGVPGGYIAPEPDEQSLISALQQHAVDTVILVGYLKKIRASMLEAFPNRILNIHPGPMRFGGKGMYGNAVHEAVIAAGCKTTGPTVHIVDQYYDHGKVLGHMPIAIKATDTPESLGAACSAAIPALYIEVLQNFLREE